MRAQRPKTYGLANAALILGIVALVTLPLSLGIPAVIGMIMGIIALVKIRKSDGKLAGNGVAMAGMIISLIAIILAAIMITFVLWIFGIFGNIADSFMLE